MRHFLINRRKGIFIGSGFLLLIFGVYFIWPAKKTFPRFLCGVSPSKINQFSLDTTVKLVYYHPWKWQQRKLHVYFTDVYDTLLPQKVLRYANRWTLYTKITFKQTLSIGDSEIRVAFRAANGYQSLIGSLADSAKGKFKLGATMWLEDLDRETEEVFKRVVLHEFGHAIGLLHELQNRHSPIQWDSQKVYHYFDTAYHWDRNTVNEQVLAPVVFGEATDFDPESIMIYAIPPFLMKNHAGISWPSDLSQKDKQKIKLVYP